jgi:hypothetical protein
MADFSAFAGGAMSLYVPLRKTTLSSGYPNTQRNEVGNFQPPLLGNIQPALTAISME